MRRFFIPSGNIDGGRAVIDGSDFHHLARVLRKAVGDTIEATDGWGNFLRIKISEIGADHAFGTIVERNPVSERGVSVTLYQAIPRQGIFDNIVEKAVELGVRRIVPVITERTTVRFDDERGDKKLGRWRRIAEETIKKVGRADRVEILPVCGLGGIAEFLHDGSLKMTAWEMEESTTLKAFLSASRGVIDVETLIGPEGGLSEGEIEKLRGFGFSTVSLGKRILRVETAAISILSGIFYELDS